MPNACSTGQGAPNRYSRTIDFIGQSGFDALRRAFVAIVGMGGVGSHAAVALARAGIGSLRLIDCDVIDATDLNRHAVARPPDIGQKKVEVMKAHLAEIAPETNIDAQDAFFHLDTAKELLQGSPRLVLDAIDSLNPKVALLRYCVENNIEVLSSMGASARANPALISIGPIETTWGCPLARDVRRRLRRQGIERGITAIYSTEPRMKTLPADEEETGRGRARRRLPSLSTLPGIFGYALASVAINRLAGLKQPE